MENALSTLSDTSNYQNVACLVPMNFWPHIMKKLTFVKL